ncbi:MAG: DNA adenine methylase [Planctomycetes bacterium]|nr:DNA adenine methylase [Planctomycetota bacterium]
MKIGALAPWFGGKRTLAPRIVAELGRHSAYWEPFCGSMAVTLAKSECPMETVNDLNGDLVNMARCVQHEQHGPRLYRRLRRTLASHILLNEAAQRVREYERSAAGSEIDEDRAFDYFIASWLGRNGVAGTHSFNQGFSRRFTKNGGHAAKRWQSAVESIPAWRRRMRNLTILSECGIGLCDRIEDAEGVAIYADPPYLVKGAKYVHDFEDADHIRLAKSLGRFTRTRVVVSYYADPRLRELYPGWTVVDCTMTKALVNQGMRDEGGAVEAPEVLLINGPSLTEGGLFNLPTMRIGASEGVLPGEPRGNREPERSGKRVTARKAKRGQLCTDTASQDGVQHSEGAAVDAPSLLAGGAA